MKWQDYSIPSTAVDSQSPTTTLVNIYRSRTSTSASSRELINLTVKILTVLKNYVVLGSLFGNKTPPPSPTYSAPASRLAPTTAPRRLITVLILTEVQSVGRMIGRLVQIGNKKFSHLTKLEF